MSEGSSQGKIDWKEGGLLIEEYKILSTHYFHEDNYFLRTVGLFGTFCTALLTIFGSNLVSKAELLVRFAILILGFVTSIVWGIGLIRIRYLRKQIERRTAELEISINDFWISKNNKPEFPILRIRNRNETANFVQRMPVSLLYQVFPLTFLLIFTSLIFFKLFPAIIN